eukprot:m.168526 g.168526  ORF g.168526 m.168526 type:complete len:511 (+) comp9910_c1_seq9:3197-4729(+)
MVVVVPSSTPAPGLERLETGLASLVDDVRPYLTAPPKPTLQPLYLASRGTDKTTEALQKRLRLDSDVLRDLHHPQSLAALRNLVHSSPGVKLQRIFSEAVHRRHLLELYEHAEPGEQARLISQAQEGAVAYLWAIPSEPELSLSDAVMRSSLRTQLGIPVGPDGRSVEEILARCTCNQNKRPGEQPASSLDTPADATVIGACDAANDMANCSKGSGLIARHDGIVATGVAMIRSCDHEVIPEERATYLATGNGGPDMTVKNFPRQGCNAFVEVSITNPSQASLRQDAARFPLIAARDRERQKIDKYVEVALSNNMRLHPFVVEAHGALGPHAIKLIKTLADSCPTTASHKRAPTGQRSNVVQVEEDEEGPSQSGSGRQFVQYWIQPVLDTTVLHLSEARQLRHDGTHRAGGPVVCGDSRPPDALPRPSGEASHHNQAPGSTPGQQGSTGREGGQAYDLAQTIGKRADGNRLYPIGDPGRSPFATRQHPVSEHRRAAGGSHLLEAPNQHRA